MKGAKVRLYVDHPLALGQSVPLSRDQAHYLFGVMRLTQGASVLVFNGRNGEWRATLSQSGKRAGTLHCEEHTAPQQNPPDIWLLFAPIKKARTDFIVEKASELGAARILPVQTEFTNSERIRQDRLHAHAVEAAEQCGGTYVPPVHEIRKLSSVLDSWPEERELIFCDEALAADVGHPGASPDPFSFKSVPTAPAAILIGPEGGFSQAERARLRGMATSV
ncbi:MAG: 16S rRNA (uracil(1498)-N(3))-methyltransferase, partial [Pseudomonadota bacterium]